MCLREAEDLAKFFAFYKKQKANLMYLRFEDIIENKQKALEQCFKFILDTESLEGSNVEALIKQVVDDKPETCQIYKLKDQTYNRS